MNNEDPDPQEGEETSREDEAVAKASLEIVVR